MSTLWQNIIVKYYTPHISFFLHTLFNLNEHYAIYAETAFQKSPSCFLDFIIEIYITYKKYFIRSIYFCYPPIYYVKDPTIRSQKLFLSRIS